MKANYLLKGLVKSIPGVEYLYKFHKATGGTCSARYCYSVWLRHLHYAFKNGNNKVPENIAEFGPGDSLGIGLSALISGAEKYYALDIVQYCNVETNLKIFDELVALFRQRARIPDYSEFPLVKPELDSYDFPAYILTDDKLEYLLSEERIEMIRNAIRKAYERQPGNMINFIVPWYGETIIKDGSLDMIFSQAVLQHIDDLELTFSTMNKWLKQGGLLSHEIDFTSMESADSLFGHWEYSDLEWKIIKGRKLFYINREPYSTYIGLLSKYKFDIVCEKKSIIDSEADSGKLSARFKKLSLEDKITANLFFQAKKQV